MRKENRPTTLEGFTRYTKSRAYQKTPYMNLSSTGALRLNPAMREDIFGLKNPEYCEIYIRDADFVVAIKFYVQKPMAADGVRKINITADGAINFSILGLLTEHKFSPPKNTKEICEFWRNDDVLFFSIRDVVRDLETPTIPEA